MKSTTIELTKEEAKVIYHALRYYEMHKENSQYPAIQERVSVIEDLTSWDGKIYNALKDLRG